jgi:hypothetical protein
MRFILRPFCILIVKFLQRRYKQITIKNRHNQTNQVLSKLKLIQSILYYFKSQFHAWGYFHPDCGWSEKDEFKFRKLFPTKDFEELDLVVLHNPNAITYYQNRIYDLTNGKSVKSSDIEKQLRKWNDWN